MGVFFSYSNLTDWALQSSEYQHLTCHIAYVALEVKCYKTCELLE